MLEDRYYHSPRTQLTPLVRSVQNSLDVRDKSVSGTDDDMEPTAIAPTLGAPGSSRVVSKTPPISAACYVPRIPRTDHRGHFLRGATLQKLEIRDPPRKQYRSVARPATTAFDPPCFPGAKAVHQIYLANQAHPAFYPPPFAEGKTSFSARLRCPFLFPTSSRLVLFWAEGCLMVWIPIEMAFLLHCQTAPTVLTPQTWSVRLILSGCCP